MQKGFQLNDLKICPGQGAICPIQMFVNPDEAEKKYLVSELKLDEHTLTSALDPDEQSRLEFEPEHLALILKRPQNYSAR
ncbi:MAG: magnesium transporter CorA family protein, partial [bacterium]|nr:magnesium transporter CorA family protein [bacterium]